MMKFNVKKFFIIEFICVCFQMSIFADENILGNKSFSPELVKNIDINFAAGEATIKSDSVDEIIVEVRGNENVSKPKIQIKNGTLSVKTKLFSSFKKQHKITVIIPNNFSLGTINLVASNASFKTENLNCSSINILNSAGDLEISNCVISDFAKLASGSGKINLYETACNSIVASTVGGETKIENCNINLLQMESVSGHINLLLPESIESYHAIVNTGSFFSDEFTDLKSSNCTNFISDYNYNAVESKKVFQIKLDSRSGNISIKKAN